MYRASAHYKKMDHLVFFIGLASVQKPPGYEELNTEMVWDVITQLHWHLHKSQSFSL